MIKTGWPKKRDSLSGNLQNYFNFRDELSIQDGFVIKGECLVIPAAARNVRKQKVHANHISGMSVTRKVNHLLVRYEQGPGSLHIQCIPC